MTGQLLAEGPSSTASAEMHIHPKMAAIITCSTTRRIVPVLLQSRIILWPAEWVIGQPVPNVPQVDTTSHSP